jgi:phosphotriesterase-related protein
MASGIAIVAGCGFYVEDFRNDILLDASIDDLVVKMVADVREGIGESAIRAGIIGEIGCSDAWTATERKTLRAAAIAQCETGASLNVHPPRSVAALLEIMHTIDEAGGDPSRCILSHIDRTVFALDDLFRLADTGCVIEYDFFGIESSFYPFQDIDLPNDAMRLNAIRALIDRGHLLQITLSQDICTKTRLMRHGGHGYGHLFTNVLPVMRRKGFSDEEIGSLTIETPRRLLTLPDV